MTWVASCANADDHPAVQGVHKFAELVEEKSGGRMHIDVFANAQLASDRDCIEGMQMNTIQSGIMVSSALAGFTDELLVFDLPFLFENSAQGQAVCDSDVGQQILGTWRTSASKAWAGWSTACATSPTVSVPSRSPRTCRASRSAPWRTLSTWPPSKSWVLIPLLWPLVSCSPLCSRAPSTPGEPPVRHHLQPLQ